MAMSESEGGKYLYCIIRTGEPVEFPFAGVNGVRERVRTVQAGQLAAVTGNAAVDTYRFTRSTAMAHQSVIQEVMQQFTVLPFSFGTVASSEEEVRELLVRYQEDFLAQLQYHDGKAEYGLKGLWRDKEQPFREILAQREDIRRYRDAIARRSPATTHQDRIQIGRMVQEALEVKREVESRDIVERLRPLAVDVRLNVIFMDQMLLNAAFLLVKGLEPAFEEALRVLDQEYEDRVRFRLVGPSPPFNFVHMPINFEARD
jgi:hypothetical protein